MAIILTDSAAYPAKAFSVSRSDGFVTLVAEASDLGFRGSRRIYDDACDVGVAVRSERTGQTVRFYEKDQDVREGHVCGWWFEPIPEDVRRGRVPANARILIIND